MSCCRKLFLLISALCLFPGHAVAQWVPDGVKLCVDGCGAINPRLIGDESGGAFVVWQDARGAEDVFMQRLTAEGLVAPAWPLNGFPVCSEPSAQYVWDITPDGDGGAYVVWQDFRNALTLGTGQDIYLQRVTAAGALYPGWPVNGVPVCRARRYQSFPEVSTDGENGALLVWDDLRDDNYDIYAHRLLSDGSPAPGWSEDGQPVCTLPSHQITPKVAEDRMGGAFFFWSDARNGTSDIYGTHLLANGTIAPGWSQQGDPIAVGPGSQRVSRAIPDEAAGAYVAWEDSEGDFGPSDIWAVRLNADGSPAPGWPVGGIPVASTTARQSQHVIAPDGLGGLLLAWTDYRNSATHGADIYAQRLMPDGTVAPGWPAEGARVCERAPFDVDPSIAPDGLGGAYVAYEGVGGSTQIFVQHLSAGGERLWFPNGSLATSAFGQFSPKIIADGATGAIVAWEGSGGSIWAQRFVADGPVPVQLALVRAEATPDRVVLLWQGPGAGGLQAQVQRRTDVAEWQPVGEAVSEGGDRLRFEDVSVEAGSRYAYRLAYEEAGIEHTSVETWVEVPAAFDLALHGFRPNPARGGAVAVAFTLPDNAPASVEVMDVAGRRVARRDVGALGAGRHLMRLTDARLAPGVYLIRLVHGGSDTVARGVVTR